VSLGSKCAVSEKLVRAWDVLPFACGIGRCRYERGFSVVVPLYNEEQSVAMLQRELADALTGLDYEIIFVDDGSPGRNCCPDRTQSADPGSALRKKMPDKARLFSPVCRQSRSEIAVLIDGDLQNDPADIPRLLVEISRGADLVCGLSRPGARTLC